MAGPTLAETQKMAGGPPSHLSDYFKAWLVANPATPAPLTNAQIGQSGPGFWADMVRQGGTVVSP